MNIEKSLKKQMISAGCPNCAAEKLTKKITKTKIRKISILCCF